jgi:hypothetical protein
MSTSSNTVPDVASNGASLEDLAQRMRDTGVDSTTVDKFCTDLRKCNIFTMGALRAFHESLETLVYKRYEDTVIGQLQAQGFIATLRVRAYDPEHVCSVLRSFSCTPICTGSCWSACAWKCSGTPVERKGCG